MPKTIFPFVLLVWKRAIWKCALAGILKKCYRALFAFSVIFPDADNDHFDEKSRHLNLISLLTVFTTKSRV